MELTKQDLRTIRAVSLFSELDPALLVDAMERFGGKVSVFASGEIILSPDAQPPQAGLVLSGKASVTTPDTAHAVLLRFLKSGDLFGIANLFSSEPFVSRICAENACRCLFLSQEAFAYLLDASPSLRRAYVGFLSDRIRFLNRKIGYLTAGSAERRLALYIASLGEGTVRLQDSITSLSELLNLGRASLYRAFDRLIRDGFLTKNGKELTVHDPKAMLDAYKQ